jgi:hypothetical protein
VSVQDQMTKHPRALLLAFAWPLINLITDKRTPIRFNNRWITNAVSIFTASQRSAVCQSVCVIRYNRNSTHQHVMTKPVSCQLSMLCQPPQAHASSHTATNPLCRTSRGTMTSFPSAHSPCVSKTTRAASGSVCGNLNF